MNGVNVVLLPLRIEGSEVSLPIYNVDSGLNRALVAGEEWILGNLALWILLDIYHSILLSRWLGVEVEVHLPLKRLLFPSGRGRIDDLYGAKGSLGLLPVRRFVLLALFLARGILLKPFDCCAVEWVAGDRRH